MSPVFWARAGPDTTRHRGRWPVSWQLSGVKRTPNASLVAAANDPKRTSALVEMLGRLSVL